MQYVAPYSFIPTGNLVLHLHADDLAYLRASGLNDETIRAAGVYSISPRDMAHFFNRRGVPAEIETALCFPYQGGEFARMKLFPSLGNMKYAQPPKTGARLYAPFTVKPGDIVVTEGEKKDACGIPGGIECRGHRRCVELAFRWRADRGLESNPTGWARSDDHSGFGRVSAHRFNARDLFARARDPGAWRRSRSCASSATQHREIWP